MERRGEELRGEELRGEEFRGEELCGDDMRRDSTLPNRDLEKGESELERGRRRLGEKEVSRAECDELEPNVGGGGGKSSSGSIFRVACSIVRCVQGVQCDCTIFSVVARAVDVVAVYNVILDVRYKPLFIIILLNLLYSLDFVFRDHLITTRVPHVILTTSRFIGPKSQYKAGFAGTFRVPNLCTLINI